MNAQFAPLTTARITPFRAAGHGATRLPAMAQQQVSPLQLADRILSLAQAADNAGHPAAAAHLLDVMYAVLDRPN